jgi:hypothetical protein
MATKAAITTKRERITPAKAEQYLNRNTCNRPLRPGVVEKYAQDMRSGNWTECAADIVIYDTHEIGDGQHRLYAIVESQTTQEFFVKRNFPKSAALNVDTGASRSFIDNIHIAGGDKISKQVLSIIKWVEYGARRPAGSNRALSFAETQVLLSKHREAAEFAADFMGRGKRTITAPVVSAVARAWYVEPDKNKLLRFGEVLASGMYEGDKEVSAVTLRNYLHSAAMNSIAGDAFDQDLFRKTQNVIKHFVEGKPLRVIKAIKDEAYPLQPEKLKSKKAA